MGGFLSSFSSKRKVVKKADYFHLQRESLRKLIYFNDIVLSFQDCFKIIRGFKYLLLEESKQLKSRDLARKRVTERKNLTLRFFHAVSTTSKSKMAGTATEETPLALLFRVEAFYVPCDIMLNLYFIDQSL